MLNHSLAAASGVHFFNSNVILLLSSAKLYSAFGKVAVHLGYGT
jgi:hypothetical protein